MMPALDLTNAYHADASPEAVSTLAQTLDPLLQRIKRGEHPQMTPILNLMRHQDDLAAITALATEIRGRYRHVVIAGAGGSGLSGQVFSCLQMPGVPRLHYLENIDPDAIARVLAEIDLAHSLVIAISKSGETVETIAHFHILLDALQKAGVSPAEHMLAITSAEASSLRSAALHHRVRILEHHPDIGGRFCLLTNVGLLPAAIAGLDIAAIRRGADAALHAMHAAANAADYAPARAAALQFLLERKGRPISVLMPYSERLSGFARWVRQSWAESLGKNGKGSTLVHAAGTTDQHSQLQLYLDGPDDKHFTLLLLARAGKGQKLHLGSAAGPAYLAGKTAGDIMAAEQQATLETLTRHGRPVRVIRLESLSEHVIGALVMEWIMEIVMMGELLGVHPFDQPAVEEGKRLARAYLQSGSV